MKVSTPDPNFSHAKRRIKFSGYLRCLIIYNLVTTVDNGQLALQELRDETKDFDLVLLDLYMPEMDGFELLSLMQEEDRLSTIPVVVMSADGDKEIIANCLRTKQFC